MTAMMSAKTPRSEARGRVAGLADEPRLETVEGVSSGRDPCVRPRRTRGEGRIELLRGCGERLVGPKPPSRGRAEGRVDRLLSWCVTGRPSSDRERLIGTRPRIVSEGARGRPGGGFSSSEVADKGALSH